MCGVVCFLIFWGKVVPLAIYSLHLWGEILTCIGISAPTLATISLILG